RRRCDGHRARAVERTGAALTPWARQARCARMSVSPSPDRKTASAIAHPRCTRPSGPLPTEGSDMRRCFVLVALAALLVLAAPPCHGSDGLLGVFFDTNGSACAGAVPVASLTTLHVLLLPSGATFGGITGAELRVTPSSPGAFLLQGESVEQGAIQLGSALGTGTTIGFASCHGGTAISVLSFQVLNGGGTPSDVELRVTSRGTPSNPLLRCPLAVLCDNPVFTSVCVAGSHAILNPSAGNTCEGGRRSTQWS